MRIYRCFVIMVFIYLLLIGISLSGQDSAVIFLHMDNGRVVEKAVPMEEDALNLAYQRIVKVEGLEQLPNLDFIWFNSCQITTIDWLDGLTNIQGIALYGNPISEEECQRLQETYDWIEFHGCGE